MAKTKKKKQRKKTRKNKAYLPWTTEKHTNKEVKNMFGHTK